MLNKSKTKIIIAAIFVLLILLVPVVSSNQYYMRLLINAAVFTMLAAGIRLLASTGQLSFAQAAFMGVGAYTSALLVMKLGWNFWFCLLLAGLVSAALAVLIGVITLRIKGAYFTILTFGLGEIFMLIWASAGDLFGGWGGIANIPGPDSIANLGFNTITPYYYLAVILAILVIILMYYLSNSRFGLVLRSIGESDYLAESLGVNIMKYKVIAFAICCFVAGIAGAFFAHIQHFISPTDFTFTASLYIVIYAVIGGLGSVIGTVYGVLLLIGIPFLLGFIPNYDPKIEPIIFGTCLAMVILFLPDGLVSLPGKISDAIRHRKRLQHG